jgi:hypothetical protein
MQKHEQKPNTKECAYDGFGNELHEGDIVAFAASRWTGDYIMYTGIVLGWSEKMLRVEGIAGATNSDKPAGMEYTPIIGRVSNRKPDKCLKISGPRIPDELDESFLKFKNGSRIPDESLLNFKK